MKQNKAIECNYYCGFVCHILYHITKCYVDICVFMLCTRIHQWLYLEGDSWTHYWIVFFFTYFSLILAHYIFLFVSYTATIIKKSSLSLYVTCIGFVIRIYLYTHKKKYKNFFLFRFAHTFYVYYSVWCERCWGYIHIHFVSFVLNYGFSMYIWSEGALFSWLFSSINT